MFTMCKNIYFPIYLNTLTTTCLLFAHLFYDWALGKEEGESKKVSGQETENFIKF